MGSASTLSPWPRGWEHRNTEPRRTGQRSDQTLSSLWLPSYSLERHLTNHSYSLSLMFVDIHFFSGSLGHISWRL